jgi:sulfoxide reductase catalytic subunit YedY
VLIRKPADIRPSEITSKDNYLNRRDFMRAGAIAGGAALASPAIAAMVPETQRTIIPGIVESAFSTDEAPNSYEDVTTYNNYYEFGTGKDDPRKPAPSTLTTSSNHSMSKSASTECAASRPGRW